MCNRHVADMIAAYEAARLDEDESADGDADAAARDGDASSQSRDGLLSAVLGRLAR